MLACTLQASSVTKLQTIYILAYEMQPLAANALQNQRNPWSFHHFKCVGFFLQIHHKFQQEVCSTGVTSKLCVLNIEAFV